MLKSPTITLISLLYKRPSKCDTCMHFKDWVWINIWNVSTWGKRWNLVFQVTWHLSSSDFQWDIWTSLRLRLEVQLFLCKPHPPHASMMARWARPSSQQPKQLWWISSTGCAGQIATSCTAAVRYSSGKKTLESFSFLSSFTILGNLQNRTKILF